MISLQEGTAT